MFLSSSPRSTPAPRSLALSPSLLCSPWRIALSQGKKRSSYTSNETLLGKSQVSSSIVYGINAWLSAWEVCLCVWEGEKSALLLAAGQDTTCFMQLLFFCHHHYHFLFDKKTLLIIWQFIIRNDPLWIVARRGIQQYVNSPLVKCCKWKYFPVKCILISIYCSLRVQFFFYSVIW